MEKSKTYFFRQNIYYILQIYTDLIYVIEQNNIKNHNYFLHYKNI